MFFQASNNLKRVVDVSKYKIEDSSFEFLYCQKIYGSKNNLASNRKRFFFQIIISMEISKKRHLAKTLTGD